MGVKAGIEPCLSGHAPQFKKVLERIAPVGSTVGGKSAFHALIGLFQDVDGIDCPAYAVLSDQGTALLVQLVNDAFQNPGTRDDSDELFALGVHSKPFGCVDAGIGACDNGTRRHVPLIIEFEDQNA